MFLLHKRHFLSLLTVTAFLLMSMPLAAQTPRIPPDARGYQTTMIIQQSMQNRSYRSPSSQTSRQSSGTAHSYRSSTHSVSVRVNVPNVAISESPTTYVTIRGPDGEVRRFPLAKGVQIEYSRSPIVLRPGQSTTIRLTPMH